MLDYYILLRESIQAGLRQIGFDLAAWMLDLIACFIILFALYFVKPIWSRLKTWFFLRKQTKYFDSFYLPNEISESTNNFISTSFQNIPPSHEQEPAFTHAVVAKQPLIPFFFNVFNAPEVNNKYYIILADSGMGKTTFLVNLYYKYKTKPFKKFEIFLVPLNNPQIDEHIKSIPDELKSKSIILLDALDEDGRAAANYIQRIDDLMTLTLKFRFVLITCRTQFFPFEEAEPSEINIRKSASSGEYHKFKKIYISPFNDRDIKKYLRKKFSIFKIQKRRKAYLVVRASPYLMVRPMLLSYIDDLINVQGGLTNIYDIYHFLIKAWIDREANRKKTSERPEFRAELEKFSEKIAFKLYDNFIDDSGLSISHHLISPFAKENNVNLDELVLRSKSLLTRDANGNYKFAHKSILEYFLAIRAFKDFEFLKKFQFQNFTYSRNLYRGLCTNVLFNDSVTQTKYRFEKGVQSKAIRILIDTPDAKLFQLACGYENVVSIKARSLKVSNDYLHFLKLIEEIKELDLSNNNISESALFYNFRKLENLNLSNNRLSDFFVTNLKRLKICDLSNNRIKQISVESLSLESINLSNNPLQELNFKHCDMLAQIGIRNTKLTSIPNVPKGLALFRDNDFTILLNRTEVFMKRKPEGKVNLPKGQDGIFNDCRVSTDYCEYSYIPVLKKGGANNYDYIDGANMAIVELVRNLLVSHPDLEAAHKFQKMQIDEFFTHLRKGLAIYLNHDFFKSVEFQIEGNIIKMKLIRL